MLFLEALSAYESWTACVRAEQLRGMQDISPLVWKRVLFSSRIGSFGCSDSKCTMKAIVLCSRVCHCGCRPGHIHWDCSGQQLVLFHLLSIFSNQVKAGGHQVECGVFQVGVRDQDVGTHQPTDYSAEADFPLSTQDEALESNCYDPIPRPIHSLCCILNSKTDGETLYTKLQNCTPQLNRKSLAM